MTKINKLDLQVLAQLRQWENSIYKFIGIFQTVRRIVCSTRKSSVEVREDLASQNKLYNFKTDYETNFAALERRAIGTSY